MEMGRKKLWRAALLACAAAALVACTIIFAPHDGKNSGVAGSTREQEQAHARIREEKLEELRINEGLYSEDSIVLADTDKEQAEAIAKELGAKLRMTKQGDYAALYLPEGMTIEDAYQSDSYIGYLAEMSPDYYVRTNAVDARKKELLQQRPNYEVHDSEYASQGYLDYINMQDAWNTSKGARTTVAVIDTGIDTDNTEFRGRISDRSYNASSDKVVKDYDWSVIEDTQGHGTAVAGVLAASMDDVGIAGIAPEVEFLVIKCECGPDGTFTRGSDLVFGLAYAIEQDADVVNMSFGTYINIFEKYTQLAVDSDIICVASAGNEGSSMLSYPAADGNVIGVGALDIGSWSLADYSNFGDNSDVVAPGTVYTTTIGGNYKYETGTSLSSPIVAAATALYRSKYPHTEFTDILELLRASSTDLGILGEDWQYGFGNLDVYAFLCEEKGTITYDMMTDEVEGLTQIFVKGHAVQYMPEPERENVVFDGWYYDRECTDEVEYYDDVFTNDLTLYAKWINEDEGSAYLYTTLPDGTVEIQSYLGKRRYLTVPSEMEGKTVSSIGEGAFANNGRLRSVDLPQTITKIGGRAFSNCALLRSIEIPEQVAEIGGRAFSGCVRLANVGIVKNGALTSIGDEAFSQCGITAFDIPANLRTLGSRVFYGSASLGAIQVAQGNTSFQIKEGALYNQAGDTLLYYPTAKSGTYMVDAATTVIGEGAFAYSRVKEIQLPEGLQTISNNGFSSSSIQRIQIPASVSQIGRESFFCCTSLQSLAFGEGSRLTAIPMNAFSSCRMLKSVEIPASVQRLEQRCFSPTGLEAISFEEGSRLESIGGYAFSYTPLVGLEIPANTKAIGDSAFYACAELGHVDFTAGSRLRTIGGNAFQECRSLSSIAFPDSLAFVGRMSFFRTGLEDVVIGTGLSEIGEGAFAACQSLSSFTVEEGNRQFASYDGVLYNGDKSVLFLYPAAKEGEYALAPETRTIRSYAFAGASRLTNVRYNLGLKEIQEHAFSQCSAMGTPTLPESLETIGGYAFEYCPSMDTELAIPKKVKSIGYFAFYNDFNLSKIQIEPECELSRLGYGAFGYCGIRDFIVPGNVSSMGQEVFTGCKNLLNVTFEADSRLENLAAWVFQGANKLRQITFGENSALRVIDARACQGLERLEKMDLLPCTNLRKVGNYAFVQCKRLSQVSLPASVEEIGRYAFQGCASLSWMDVPKAVSFVGRYAFQETASINIYFKSSIMPADVEENWDYGIAGYYMGVTEIVTSGDWTYALTDEGTASVISYNGSDETVILDQLDGHEVTSIGGKAFQGNTALKRISLPDTLTGIYQGAFAGTAALEDIAIPANVSIIDNEAFQGSGIQQITFVSGSRLSSLGRHAFAETENLSEISLPDGVEKIKDYAFYKSGLTGISFGAGSQTAEIGKYAFSQSALEFIQLPEALHKIDYYAFSEAGRLTDVAFPTGTALSIYGNAFYHSGLTGVSLPANVQYIGELCFTGCGSLEEITVAPENAHYCSVDGVLFDKAQKKLITCPGGKTGGYDVAATVTTLAFSAFEESKLSNICLPTDSQLGTIGYRAFYDCENLESINIPNSVRSIDRYAFAECPKLSAVAISNEGKLSGIYESAFYNCKSLKAITIPDAVQEISEYAFYGCSALTDVAIAETSLLKGIYGHAFEDSGMTSLTMPKYLEEVGEYAFNRAKLSDLVFNDSITDVGDYAFADCGLANVTALTIPSTVEYLGKGALKGVTALKEVTLPFLGTHPDDEWNGHIGTLFGVEIFRTEGMLESLEKVTLLGGTAIYRAAFYECSRIKTIVLPEGITSIGSMAFRDSGIEQINFPTTLKTIGSFAFESVPLKNLELSEGVEYLENKAFSKTAIESASLPESLVYIGDKCFEYTKLTEIQIPKNVEKIGEAAFSGCTSLETISLSESLIYIGYKCFADTKLTEIRIPKNVEEIGEAVFSGCTSLKTIEVDKQNSHYASLDGILYDIDYIEILAVPVLLSGDITLPDTLKSIGESAFKGCSKIQSIEFPETLYSIGNEAFEHCDGLKELSIPDSVKKIGKSCFANCGSLEKAVLGNGIEKIPSSMFEACEQMKHTEIPENIISIEYDAFSGCKALEELSLPESLLSIGERAFSGCKTLEELPLPESLLSIGWHAFRGCRNLKYAYIPENVQTIGYGTFMDCFALQSIIVDEDNENYSSKDGILYDSSFTELLAVPKGIKNSVVVPEGVTRIEGVAFEYCSGLKHITFPSTLIEINDGAFEYCSGLRDISLPDSLSSIGMYAFQGCNNLNTITVSPGSNIKQIRMHAFDGTAYSRNLSNWEDGVLYLSKYAIKGKETIQNLKIKPGTITIGESCFEGNKNLKRVIMPDSVKYINREAFSGCTKLKSIDIPDGVDKIDAYAFGNNTNLQFVRIGNNDNVFSWSVFNGCGNVRTLIAPKYDELYLTKSKIVMTKKDSISCDDVGGILIYGIDLYSYADKSSWEQDLLNSPHEAKIYFAGEWNLATFYVDGMMIQTDPLKTAEAVQAPAEDLINEYLPKGASFLGWDINGDGTADSLPVTLTEDLEANAVYDAPITSIFMDAAATVEAGRSITLTAVCEPDGHNHDDTITWSSSDTSIAVVDENGKVTGIARGKATIIAALQEEPSVMAECVVTVWPVQYGIKLTKYNGELNVGDTYELNPEFVLPEDDADETRWISSDETVATVEAGKITALAPGTTYIYIKHGVYNEAYYLTVKAPLQGIRLSKQEIGLNVGDTMPMQLTYEPSNTTDDTEAFWCTSNTSVANVNSDGLITAVEPGEATIIAGIGQRIATCKVTVKAPLKGIVLDSTAGTMRIDRTKSLEVVYDPSNTTDDKSVSWSTSDPETASIDENGLVTAKKAGTATITGKVGSLEASYTVTVVGLKDEATGITVTNSDETAMEEGLSLNVEVLDEKGLQQEYPESWGELQAWMEDIANDSDGHIPVMQMYDISLSNAVGAAVQPGTPVDVEIPVSSEAAEDGAVVYRLEEDGTLTDMKATYDEEVGRYHFQTEYFSAFVLGSRSRQTYVKQITLNVSETTLCSEETLTLSAEILPEGLADTPIIWSSSDETAATVSSSGIVTAKQGGKAVITATASDKRKAHAECLITVMHDYQPKVTAPTCTEQGYTTLTCSSCGDSYIDQNSYTAATGHTWGDWEEIQSPTCTDSGSKQRICTACGYTETSGVDPNGHNWEESPTVDQAPTCTADGSQSTHCRKCNATKDSQAIPATGHSFGDWEEIKASTCTDSGSKQRTCNACGYTENIGMDPTGHDWQEDYTIDQEPTCTANGSKSIHCKKCDATKDSETISMADHNYLPKVTEPTCTEQGYTTLTCSSCGHSYIDKNSYTAATKHTWSDWEEIQSPTCTDSGSKQHTCNICGYTENIGMDPTGHDWQEDYTIDQEPTCTANGSKSIHCKKCDATKDSETIPMADHDYRFKITVPTCTEQGYVTLTCGRCGHSYIDQNSYIVADGHRFFDWEEIKASTCTDSGSKQRKCIICGYTETSGVDPNGHDWEESPSVDQAPTCTVDGSQSTHCRKCDATKDSQAIPAAGHTPDQGTVTTAPTCKAAGVRSYKCTICQEVIKEEPIGQLSHTCRTVTTKATTREDGSIAEICTACGDIISTTPIYYPKEVALSKTSYTYTGKAAKPKVTVADSSGKIIPSSNYTVKYSNNKAVGKAAVKITFKGNYSGTVSKSFTIAPKGTSLTKTAAQSKGFTIKWKKQPSQITGYEIQYSTEKKFSKEASVTKTVKKASATSLAIKKAKAGKKYYIRIRTYKTIKKAKYYSGWSKVKTATVKK